ncbi:MAG: restriction endonuclease [Maritimibacter sp.]|nr:restriction endonuclease [Maritimibacter sp.]
MTTVWGIHMPEELGAEAVEKSQVSIGWPEIGDLSKLPPDREAIKEAIARAYPDKKQGAIPVEAGVIYRFVHEVKAGDYVIYPSKHNRMVNIGKFTGEFLYAVGSEADILNMPNSRAVTWLGHFPRSDFSQSALYEIGSFITLFKVKNYAAEFLAKVDPAYIAPKLEDEDATPDDDSVSSTVTRQAEETAQDFVIKRIYSHLSGHDFESFIAHLLECMGYTVRVTQKSGDGGVDVIAHNDKLGFEPPIIKVQCKRTTNQINETQVRELLGTLVEGEYGLFVTLGAYDRKARLSERNLSKLRLIDGDQLFELVVRHYSQLSPRYRTMIPLRQIYVPDLR